MKIRGWLLIITYVTSSLTATSLEPVDDSELLDAAQDSTGLVWAIQSGGGIVVFEGAQWHRVPLSRELDHASPLAMCNGPEGKVLAFWRKEDELLVTASKGSAPKVISRFAIRVKEPGFFLDSKQQLWISERAEIWGLTLDGKTVARYSLPVQALPDFPGYFPPRLEMFEDSRGQVWFYANYLRGVIIYSGEKFWHQFLLPDRAGEIRLLARGRDNRHLWACGGLNPLWEIDLSPLTARVVSWPTSDFEDRFCEIFELGGKAHFLTDPNTSWRFEEKGDLWRLDGEHWTRVVAGLDGSGFIEYRRRPTLQTTFGTFVGTFRKGIWWFSPDAQKHKHLNWRYGVPLKTIDRLFKLRGDRLLAVELRGGSWFTSIQALLLRKPAIGADVIKSANGLVRDAAGDVWGVRTVDELSHWNGETWKTERLPALLEGGQFGGMGTDTAGGIWLFPSSEKDSTWRFDPAARQWRQFTSSRDMAQALAVNPLLTSTEIAPLVKAGRNGRIAFIALATRVEKNTNDLWNSQGPVFGNCNGSLAHRLHYYDGREWRDWRFDELEWLGRGPPLGLDFKADGTLVAYADSPWEYNHSAGWVAGKSNTKPPEPEQLVPPEGFPTRVVDSIVKDTSDTFWITSQDGLYRAREDVSVTVFAPDAAHPFIDGRALHGDAFHDKAGNAFLHTGNGEYVMVRAQPPIPDTIISDVIIRDEVASLQLAKNGTDGDSFIWRRDGEQWSKATRSESLEVRFTDNGKHIVEVCALNRDLEVDPTPARAVVEISIDWNARVAVWIAQLADEGFDKRNAAVDLLVARGELALDALRSAREPADDDKRWWIDAAIQEIERLKKSR